MTLCTVRNNMNQWRRVTHGLHLRRLAGEPDLRLVLAGPARGDGIGRPPLHRRSARRQAGCDLLPSGSAQVRAPKGERRVRVRGHGIPRSVHGAPFAGVSRPAARPRQPRDRTHPVPGRRSRSSFHHPRAGALHRARRSGAGTLLQGRVRQDRTHGRLHPGDRQHLRARPAASAVAGGRHHGVDPPGRQTPRRPGPAARAVPDRPVSERAGHSAPQAHLRDRGPQLRQHLGPLRRRVVLDERQRGRQVPAAGHRTAHPHGEGLRCREERHVGEPPPGGGAAAGLGRRDRALDDLPRAPRGRRDPARARLDGRSPVDRVQLPLRHQGAWPGRRRHRQGGGRSLAGAWWG